MASLLASLSFIGGTAQGTATLFPPIPLSSSGTAHSRMSSYRLTRRGNALLCFVLILLAAFIYLWRATLRAILTNSFPPLYEDVRALEQSLPHYEEYERKNVKYFFPANHIHKSSGWGNIMEDFVMNALLAHATNRSFVFDDYIWDENSSHYSEYNGKLIPARIPLSALLSGPMVGQSWPPGDDTPLSVSRDFFHEVCPNPTVLRVSDINTHDMRFNDNVSVAYIFEKWADTIASIEDPCLMVDPSSDQIFDYWLYGEKNRMLPIWPYLSKSPVVTHLGWSPLIQDAYMRNRYLFRPTFQGSIDSSDASSMSPIPGLLAIHVRRGDFKDHCKLLARTSVDWNAFNSFPEFHDKFELPTAHGRGETSDNMELYAQRCYPTIDEIVTKVRQVREDATDPLEYLYIMTNGAPSWVEELKAALAEDMAWAQIGSSRDLNVTWEQKFVAQALDMYIAQRAQVFIGNGWSSLTSNVVMLRMARELEPQTNRFW